MSESRPYVPGEFCWVDLSAHDMADAKTFYADVFGWDAVDQDTHGGPPYAAFQVGGDIVAGLGEMNDAMKSQGVPPNWNCYVEVANADAAVEKAASLGGTVIVPVMDVPGHGRLAYFADPTGAVVAVWQAMPGCGRPLRHVANSMAWHELATRDLAAAKDFYAGVFGWGYRKHDGSPSEYYVVENDGKDVGGMMAMTEAWGDAPPHWTVYFITESVADTVAKIRDHGGHVHAEPFDTEVGPIAVVADAQGACFNLMQLGQSCK